MAFSNPVVGGETLIRDSIQSENYDAGVAGWAINRDGTAEFNDITARGDIVANSVAVTTDEGTVTIQDGGTANEIILDGTPGQFSDPARIGTSSPAGSDRLEIHGPTNTGTPGVRPGLVLLDDGSQREARMDGLWTNGVGTELDFPATIPVQFAALRPAFDSLGSDGARTIVGDVSYGADYPLSVVIRRPASGIVTVDLFAQMQITAGTSQGLLSYEIRDTNSGGTIRQAAQDSAALIVDDGSGNQSKFASFTTGPLSGTSTNLFIQVMYRVASAATTCLYQRVRLQAKGEP